MRRLALFVALFFPLTASAQFGVPPDDAPIRPDRAPLAITAEVPAIFHIGLGGDAAVFVNPARAARAKHRFAYATIRPAFSADAPVAFAGLFGEGERKWLVAVENGVLSDERSERQQERQVEQVEGGTVVVEDDLISDRTYAVTSTRARALLIGRTDFGGYAFGLYGGYRSATNEDFRATNFFQDTDRTFPYPFTQTRRFQDERERVYDLDGFGIGVETALAGRTWDLAGAVSYQRVRGDFVLAYLRTETTAGEQLFEDGTRRVRNDERFSRIDSRRDAEGTAVDAELLATLRVGERRDDYLFAALSGAFGSGTEDYAVAFADRAASVIRDDGLVVSESSQDQASDDAGTLDLTGRAVRASLGYVYARRTRDMTILAGLNPSATFGHREEAVVPVSAAGPGVSRQETDETQLALALPLYVRFGVTKRLDAFGGGVYAYTYTHVESTTRPVLPDDPAYVLMRDSTSDRFVSSGRLYGGAVFTFRSGFTAQASVRGDLANVAGWIVSMGYRF